MQDIDILRVHRMLVKEIMRLQRQPRHRRETEKRAIQRVLNDEGGTQTPPYADERSRRLRAKRMELATLSEDFERILSEECNGTIKRIIRLYYAQGLSDPVIAEELGLPPRYVGRLRNHFMQHLAE